MPSRGKLTVYTALVVCISVAVVPPWACGIPVGMAFIQAFIQVPAFGRLQAPGLCQSSRFILGNVSWLGCVGVALQPVPCMQGPG
jgi:hypothetical protein